MNTSRLTLDGQPVVSPLIERRIRRRKADIEIHEAKRAHQLTANALVAAIMVIESGDRSEDTLKWLKDAARLAKSVTA